MDYIAMAIPVFFALIGVEILVAWYQERKVYRFNDAINDLSCGILQQILGVFTKAIVFGVYAIFWERFRLLEIPASSWVTWTLCFIGVDFFYYWFHTRTIDKMGAFEWIFNTPSHHRVHHGCDDKYLDKNYAGTLIIWDRIFGSFQPEEKEPTYGITKPLASWNPLWANVHYYADLSRLMGRAPNWREKLKVWVKPPAWKPDWATEGPGDTKARTPLSHGEEGKYDAHGPRSFDVYVSTHYLVVILLAVFLIFRVESLPRMQSIGLALMVAWTLVNLGVLFERRRWVLGSELMRPTVVALAVIALVSGQGGHAIAFAAVPGMVLTGTSAAWLLRQRASFTF